MAAVNALHGVKTLIIVAHRLTTVSDCDLLYRLDKGRVVQSGTYAEVIPQ
jgi:ABC-type multidrug transport system fused ATPase/permease subunit